MIDVAMRAATSAAIRLRGQTVTFQRLSGAPPNVTIAPAGGARVTAFVSDYSPNPTASAQAGYSASEIGSITQGDRKIMVMADALAAAGFPLPVRKGDQAVLGSTDEVLSISRVDAAKGAIAGCIELYGTGVA